MKLPLNYAILEYFTRTNEATPDQVIAELKPEYGSYKGIKKEAVVEAIMTAESNALLEEVRYELDGKGVLQVYYRANDEQRATILKYIS